MVPFSGWEMPIHFSGVIQEHHAVRKKVGVFDISHMGILKLSGKNPKDELQGLVPTDLHRIGNGESCYTVLLNDKGGIIDDLLIYDLESNNDDNETLLIIVNAGCTAKDIKWLKMNLESSSIKLESLDKHVLLAIQGPKSLDILSDITKENLKTLPRFGHRKIQLTLGSDNKSNTIFISKTGYTGEEGFELLMPDSVGKLLWNILMRKGVTPCGLGARDTLRLEAAMHLYGEDINSKTTPFEAGLGWLVHLEMPHDFIGREALELEAQKGAKRSLVGIKLKDRSIGRSGYSVIHQGQQIGRITSGTWSPTLEEAIALAYIPRDLAKIGTKLEVEIRGKNHPGEVVKKPFYRQHSKT